MKNQTLKHLFIAALLLLALPACTTSTKNFQAGVIPPFQPVSQEVAQENKSKLGAIMDKQEIELSQEGPEYDRVKRLINDLSVHAEVGQELDVYTAEAGDQVNAFAMGGNTIVVYNELLRRMPNDEDLVVVLAHEMAHLLGGHNGDKTMQKRGAAVGALGMLAQIAVVVASGDAGLGELAGDTVGLVGTGVVLSYGRAMEHEADHVGMLLMAKAGYDPKKAIYVWDNADKFLGAGSNMQFFSSHPSHGNRKKRLEEDYVYAEPIYEASVKKEKTVDKNTEN